MAAGWFSTQSVDYLQRSGPLPPEVAGAVTAGRASARRLLRVSGIGSRVKEQRPPRLQPGESWRSAMAGPITGLYGYRIPLAFLLECRGGAVRIQLGTWASRHDAAPPAQDRPRAVLPS